MVLRPVYYPVAPLFDWKEISSKFVISFNQFLNYSIINVYPLAWYLGTYGWTFNYGQLMGSISLAAFNFIVQLPNVFIDLVNAISFDSKLLMYLIIKFSECIVLNIFCFIKFYGRFIDSGKAWASSSIFSILSFCFPVNLAKSSLIYSMSSKVVTSDTANEIDYLLFFLKLIWFSSKNLVIF